MKFTRWCFIFMLMLWCILLAGCGQTGAGKIANSAPPLSTEDKVRNLVAKMTLEEKVGQMLIVGIPGKVADKDTLDLIRKYHAGGILYSERNLDTQQQVQALTLALQSQAEEEPFPIPLFICIAQEGGQVAGMRGYLPVAQSQASIGIMGNPARAKEWAVQTATGIKKLGINVNLAPVADLGSRAGRSYGTEAEQVVPFVAAAVDGYVQSGVISTLKHFPGVGRAMGDFSYDVAQVSASRAELEQEDMVPFKYVVDNKPNKRFMIMVSNLIYPAYEKVPASVSKVLLIDLLRGKWNYKGVVITDDMSRGGLSSLYSVADMGVLAVNAGVDVLLLGGEDPTDTITIYKSIVEGVKNGVIPRARIDESVTRILMTKEENKLLNLEKLAG
jgi:beta-N-acetylhexosaminidase